MLSLWCDSQWWFSGAAAAATTASAVIYHRMLQLQKAIRDAQRDIDLRVDVDFVDDQRKGVPSVWIENSDEGRGFIESVELIIRSASGDKAWELPLYIAGKRRLEGFSEACFQTLPAFRIVAKEEWSQSNPEVGVSFFAFVVVCVGRHEYITQNSETYATNIVSDTGDVTQLIHTQPDSKRHYIPDSRRASKRDSGQRRNEI